MRGFFAALRMTNEKLRNDKQNSGFAETSGENRADRSVVSGYKQETAGVESGSHASIAGVAIAGLPRGRACR